MLRTKRSTLEPRGLPLGEGRCWFSSEAMYARYWFQVMPEAKRSSVTAESDMMRSFPGGADSRPPLCVILVAGA